MSDHPRPPRAAVWLAALAFPADEREGVLGDLEEAFGRRAVRSRAAAVAWYWGQVALLWSGVPGRWGPWGGGTMSMSGMGRGLWQATRRLARDWRFAVSLVVVLGMGTAAALVAWSVVDRVLLRPLPYAQPERLGLIRVDLGDLGGHPGIAMAEIADLRALDGVFDAVGAADAERVRTLEVDARLEPVLSARVTPGLFEMLGAAPATGRTFTEADALGASPYVVLSHPFWRDRLGADPGAVGRTVRIDGADFEVVGVMPEGFALHLGKGANVSSGVEVWTPLRIDPDRRNFWGFRTVVRLAGDTPFPVVNATLESLAVTLRERWPDAYGTGRLHFVAHPLQEDLLRDVRPAVNTAVAGVLLLLLVSFANGASLMLGRQRAREAALAVRSALGAGRARLVGVVLAESLVLAAASGAVGATLAAWGVSALRGLRPEGVPRWGDLGLDGRFLLAALVLVIAGAVVTGLYPALTVSTRGAGVLRGETLQRGVRGAGVRRSLVGVQVALSVVLVFGATVLARSGLRLASVDLGFDPHHVLTLAVPTDGTRFGSAEEIWRFHRELGSRVREMPGVIAAGAVSHLPLAGYAPTDAFSLPTSDTLNWGNHLANYFATTPGYLEALGVELRSGRTLEDRDLDEARAVAVVDESFAEALFPGESPLGRIVKPGWGIPDVEVVGVIRHPRVMDVRTELRPQMYVPFTVFEWGPLSWAVRTAGDPAALAPALRREIDELGAGRAVYHVRPLDGYVAAATSTMRTTLALIVAQAIMTALLAALGLFTVIAYVAYQARRDTAIRSALGATRGELLSHHLQGGVGILLVAIPVGVALSLLGSRLLTGLVYEVSSADVASLVLAAATTTLVGLFATYLPARSASAADPMAALRTD